MSKELDKAREQIVELLQTPLASYDPQLGFRYLSIDKAISSKIADEILALKVGEKKTIGELIEEMGWSVRP